MNKNLKTFLTIFCYITAIAALVTMVVDLSHKPAATTNGVVWGVIGVVFLGIGIALTRRPRY